MAGEYNSLSPSVCLYVTGSIQITFSLCSSIEREGAYIYVVPPVSQPAPSGSNPAEYWMYFLYNIFRPYPSRLAPYSLGGSIGRLHRFYTAEIYRAYNHLR
jgi:hypothetical protein